MRGARRALSKEGPDRGGSRNFKALGRLGRYLRPYRLQVGLTVAALVLAAACVLVFGAGFRYLIDGAFGERHASALDHALKAALIVVVVLALATFARAYLVTWLGERLVADLRKDVYGHVVRLSPGFFEVTRTGEVLSRLTADTSVVQSVISASLSQALRNLLLLAGGLALLFVTNPKLTLLILVVVPLVIVPIVVIGRRVRALSRAAQDRVGDLSGHGEETLNAVHTVQAFAQESREQAAFDRLTEHAFGAATAYARARSMLAAVVITLVFGAIVVVLWIGGRDVLAGSISGGELAAFVFYASVVASAAGGLAEIMGDLQRAAGATDAPVRSPGHAAPDPGTGRAEGFARARQRCRALRGRRLRLSARSRPARAPGAGSRGAARRDGGAGRAFRCRQDHDLPASDALLRPRSGPPDLRRSRCQGRRSHRPAPQNRARAAGAGDFFRECLGQYPLRPPRGRRPGGAGRGCGGCGHRL
ncbi:MAG: hypothetical protein HC871_01950, partial [Rhizobiales bacterium]|nr:hypothetical protein [Hyphomicrobiales bacterium]